MILEELEQARKRSATIYAEVLGCGQHGRRPPHHAPHPSGAGAAEAMQSALSDAKLNPEDIQYINAHGTSTPLGDEAETKAIKEVFGSHARQVGDQQHQEHARPSARRQRRRRVDRLRR